jgi:glycerol-3-phosphate acyltransferase PlsY
MLAFIMEAALRIVLSVLAGYLFGCLSPAYLLGRLLKGIDIRKVGYRNAGTRNVKTILGTWPAAVTAIIDTIKGVAAILVSTRLIGLPEIMCAFPAAAAVAGHIFPFYIGFRGGKGTATAIGIFIYITALDMVAGIFSPLSFGALLLTAGVFYAASRNGDAAGIAAFAFMTAAFPVEMIAHGLPPWGPWGEAALASAISLFLLVYVTWTAVKRGTFRLEKRVELKIWRLVARPFALLFIPIDLLWGRRVLLLVVGSISLAFIAVDVYRFLSTRSLSLFFKASEARRFSSITYFLVAIFVSFLVFPAEIPSVVLAFTAVGDLGGKLIGIRFGKTVLHKTRTLEGALGFFAAGFMAAFIIYRLMPCPLLFVILGAGFAAVVEVYLTGALLFALRFFLRI